MTPAQHKPDRLRIDLIRRLLRSRAHQRVARAIERLDAAEFAALLAELTAGETANLLDVLLDLHQAADRLMELPPGFLPKVLGRIDDDRLARIVARLEPDDAADLLLALDEPRRRRILDRLPPDRRSPVERVLLYPPDTAGGLMTPWFLALDAHTTAAQAIERIRSAPELADTLFQVYVTDEDGHLAGTVPLRRLMTAPPDTPLSDIMLPDPIAVPAWADQEEVARVVARNDLFAVPVVDEQRRVLGVVTVDDVIDVIEQEATEDIYHLAGLQEQDRVFSPPLESVRRRLPWNALNLLTAFIAANVVGAFEGVIAQMAALAAFMPIVAGMGGNTGTQALTVITRGIALGEIEFSSGLRALGKEATVGLTIGLLTGCVAGLGAWVFLGTPMVGVVVFLAMLVNLTVAALVGAAIPLVLKAAGQDPALGSSVLLTAVTDSFGYFCLFTFARLFLDLD